MVGSGLQKEYKPSNFEMNFWPRFDACISGSTQPIDLKLKNLVDRDFADRRCCFLCRGGRIGAVLFRHLGRRAMKVVSWLSVFLRG